MTERTPIEKARQAWINGNCSAVITLAKMENGGPALARELLERLFYGRPEIREGMERVIAQIEERQRASDG